MNNQTEKYIVLKPLAERFSKIANEIDDDTIRSIIKDELREQVRNAIDFGPLSVYIEEYVDDNEDEIKRLIRDSIQQHFKIGGRY